MCQVEIIKIHILSNQTVKSVKRGWKEDFSTVSKLGAHEVINIEGEFIA